MKQQNLTQSAGQFFSGIIIVGVFFLLLYVGYAYGVSLK